ncbi:MAG: hypothetical protein WCP29_07185 [Acidobacteriota bacterium]
MKHLVPEDVVDVLDGCAGPAVVGHAESCDRCRAMVAALRTSTEWAAADQGAEPPADAMRQLSVRVGAAVRRAPDPGSWWSRWWSGSWSGWNSSWRALPAGSLVVVCVLLAAAAWQGTGREVPRGGDVAGGVAPVEEVLVSGPAVDEAWNVVSGVAADLAATEPAGGELAGTIGAADRAVDSLSDGEQAELARLLKAELDQPDSTR